MTKNVLHNNINFSTHSNVLLNEFEIEFSALTKREFDNFFHTLSCAMQTGCTTPTFSRIGSLSTC